MTVRLFNAGKAVDRHASLQAPTCVRKARDREGQMLLGSAASSKHGGEGKRNGYA